MALTFFESGIDQFPGRCTPHGAERLSAWQLFSAFMQQATTKPLSASRALGCLPQADYDFDIAVLDLFIADDGRRSQNSAISPFWNTRFISLQNPPAAFYLLQAEPTPPRSPKLGANDSAHRPLRLQHCLVSSFQNFDCGCASLSRSGPFMKLTLNNTIAFISRLAAALKSPAILSWSLP